MIEEIHFSVFPIVNFVGGCKFNIYNMTLAIICSEMNVLKKWNAKSVHNQVV